MTVAYMRWGSGLGAFEQPEGTHHVDTKLGNRSAAETQLPVPSSTPLPTSLEQRNQRISYAADGSLMDRVQLAESGMV